jgi:hypothetical protein
VVDSIAKQCVILIDQTKVVPELGLTFPLPVRNGIVLSILSPSLVYSVLWHLLVTFYEHGCDFFLGNRLRFYHLLCLLCSGHSLALGEVTTHPLIFYHCNIWYFSCYWVLQSWNLLDPMDLSITGSHANCWMNWEFMESLKLEDPCSHANK